MWQILIIVYCVFGTGTFLLRRVLAQKAPEYNRLINSTFFIFFLLPVTLILFPFFPHNLSVGWLDFFLLLLGGSLFPIVNILAFRANKKVDAGIFAIFNNLSPIFTILMALIFLGESLSSLQFLGAGLLIFSGGLATFSQTRGGEKVSLSGIYACLLATIVLGIAVAYERFMLTRVDFGAYLIYGWGAQIAWSLWFARKELKFLPKLLGKEMNLKKIVLSWGLVSVIRSVAFVLALKLGTASIISSASNFLSVLVVIGGYFFLKERSHISYKIIAVILGILGLFFIAR